MDPVETEIRIYQQADGRIPYLSWLARLRDRQARQRIQARIARLRLGNAGQVRSVGGGVHELKVDYGPGYRVYFARLGQEVVILLCGGDKSSQSADIEQAQEFWQEYLKERRHADG